MQGDHLGQDGGDDGQYSRQPELLHHVNRWRSVKRYRYKKSYRRPYPRYIPPYPYPDFKESIHFKPDCEMEEEFNEDLVDEEMIIPFAEYGNPPELSIIESFPESKKTTKFITQATESSTIEMNTEQFRESSETTRQEEILMDTTVPISIPQTGRSSTDQQTTTPGTSTQPTELQTTLFAPLIPNRTEIPINTSFFIPSSEDFNAYDEIQVRRSALFYITNGSIPFYPINNQEDSEIPESLPGVLVNFTAFTVLDRNETNSVNQTLDYIPRNITLPDKFIKLLPIEEVRIPETEQPYSEPMRIITTPLTTAAPTQIIPTTLVDAISGIDRTRAITEIATVPVINTTEPETTMQMTTPDTTTHRPTSTEATIIHLTNRTGGITTSSTSTTASTSQRLSTKIAVETTQEIIMNTTIFPASTEVKRSTRTTQPVLLEPTANTTFNRSSAQITTPTISILPTLPHIGLPLNITQVDISQNVTDTSPEHFISTETFVNQTSIVSDEMTSSIIHEQNTNESSLYTNFTTIVYPITPGENKSFERIVPLYSRPILTTLEPCDGSNTTSDCFIIHIPIREYMNETMPYVCMRTAYDTFSIPTFQTTPESSFPNFTSQQHRVTSSDAQAQIHTMSAPSTQTSELSTPNTTSTHAQRTTPSTMLVNSSTEFSQPNKSQNTFATNFTTNMLVDKSDAMTSNQITTPELFTRQSVTSRGGVTSYNTTTSIETTTRATTTIELDKFVNQTSLADGNVSLSISTPTVQDSILSRNLTETTSVYGQTSTEAIADNLTSEMPVQVFGNRSSTENVIRLPSGTISVNNINATVSTTFTHSIQTSKDLQYNNSGQIIIPDNRSSTTMITITSTSPITQSNISTPNKSSPIIPTMQDTSIIPSTGGQTTSQTETQSSTNVTGAMTTLSSTSPFQNISTIPVSQPEKVTNIVRPIVNLTTTISFDTTTNPPTKSSISSSPVTTPPSIVPPKSMNTTQSALGVRMISVGTSPTSTTRRMMSKIPQSFPSVHSSVINSNNLMFQTTESSTSTQSVTPLAAIQTIAPAGASVTTGMLGPHSAVVAVIISVLVLLIIVLMMNWVACYCYDKKYRRRLSMEQRQLTLRGFPTPHVHPYNMLMPYELNTRVNTAYYDFQRAQMGHVGYNQAHVMYPSAPPPINDIRIDGQSHLQNASADPTHLVNENVMREKPGTTVDATGTFGYAIPAFYPCISNRPEVPIFYPGQVRQASTTLPPPHSLHYGQIDHSTNALDGIGQNRRSLSQQNVSTFGHH